MIGRFRALALALTVGLGTAGGPAGCLLAAGDAPRVDAVAPPSLPAALGGTLTIDGAGFAVGAVLDVSAAPSVWLDDFRVWLGAEEIVLGGVVRLSDSRLVATVPAAAPTGVYDLTVEMPDGRRASLSGAVTLTPSPGAALVIARVEAGASAVYAGQQDVPVVVTLQNPGLEAALVSSIALRMTAGADDRTAEYEAEEAPGNPAAILAGGEVTWTFLVDVRPDATLGAVAVDAVAAGTSAQSGVPLEDDASAAPDAWTVNPSPLLIEEVSSGVMVVTPGQAAVPLQVGLHNESATDTVRVESVDVVFGAPGFTATIISPLLPFDLLSGATFNVTFGTDVSATAAPGIVTLDARAVGSVLPGGASLVADGAALTDQWTVN